MDGMGMEVSADGDGIMHCALCRLRDEREDG